DAVRVCVLLADVRNFRAVVVGIGDEVAVLVRIAAVSDLVAVDVALGRIELRGTVVDGIVDAVTIGVGRRRTLRNEEERRKQRCADPQASTTDRLHGWPPVSPALTLPSCCPQRKSFGVGNPPLEGLRFCEAARGYPPSADSAPRASRRCSE